MFETLQTPPPDKILALSAAFRADPRTEKLDLGVGVYKDEAGETVILNTVKTAERRLLETQTTKTYVSPAGDEGFNAAMAKLVFGDAVEPARIAAVQTPGGTGACRMLAELVARAERGATVWLPEPTWPNHAGIVRQAGLSFSTYPYFDPETLGVDWKGMRSALSHAGPGDVVLIHGCCHNPTGADLTAAQWGDLAALAAEREFTPFIDLAYQGFGEGLEADVAGVRLMAAAVPELLLAASCSKNFALYRERVGCAMALAATPEAATLVKESMKALARVNHSMPPDHGAAVVRTILEDPTLRAEWEAEVAAMRARVLDLRAALAEGLRARLNDDRFDFLLSHKGMFSRIGATPEQVERLREDHGVYMVGDGRINVAGLNKAGVARLIEALVAAGV
ncbi:MAG: aspartate/tyrosine/aromatic aminotransferase [Rhodobacteraceae bacterium]|nr:MAG: aspartate/tyrosine/aromatic aminotransferase [Paracoccaceae bacterium]